MSSKELSQIRPPDYPKPSYKFNHSAVKDAYARTSQVSKAEVIKNGLMAKAELRSRLVLGWNSKSLGTCERSAMDSVVPIAPPYNNETSLKVTKILGKKTIFTSYVNESSVNSYGSAIDAYSSINGYGEEQFDISDSRDKVNKFVSPSHWFTGPSISVDETRNHSLLPSSNSVDTVMKSRSKSRGRSTISRSSYLERDSLFLTAIHSVSRPESSYDSSHRNDVQKSSTPAHLAVSSMYYSCASVDNSPPDGNVEDDKVVDMSPFPNKLTNGVDYLATTLVSKEGAAFCYLQQTVDNCYSFSIRDTVPNTILNNEYVTLGKGGVLRAVRNGDCEFVTHTSFQREHDIYCKLKELTLFGKFKIWKPFQAWKFQIRERRWRLAVIIRYT